MDSVSTFRSLPRSKAASDSTTLSRGLGWFSVALGLTEIAMPRALARTIGVDDPGPATAWLIRAMGVRELVNGIGVLMQPRRSAPLWTRVLGDAIDLALLSERPVGGRSTPRDWLVVGGAAALFIAVIGLVIYGIVALVRAIA